jgi:serine/threonine protein kinase
MGTVRLCTDEVLGREVAVKQVGLLPGESAPDLHHPHVVAVFDAVEGEDDRIWLVMEHVPGTTLAEIVSAEGRLEPRRLLVERSGEGWVISDDLGPA